MNRPPRTKIAPPPSIVSVPAERPFTNRRRCTVRVGWSWFWQWDVVQTRSGSHVFMYRIRRALWPSRVTRPPPSMTTSGLSLKTFAVAFIAMVTGFGPQSKVMTPPWATAFTTAAEVQLPGVPVPTTWSGSEVSTGRAAERDRRIAGRVARRGRRWGHRSELQRALQERRHLPASDDLAGTELAIAATGRDARGRESVDVGRERVIRRHIAERDAARRGQRQGADQERRHLPAGHRVVRAEPVVGGRVAALGDARGRELVDIDRERPRYIGEVGPAGRRQPKTSDQEGRHLRPGDGVPRAEQVVEGRVAAAGDAGGGDRLDRALEDRPVVVDEGAARREGRTRGRRRGEQPRDEGEDRDQRGASKAGHRQDGQPSRAPRRAVGVASTGRRRWSYRAWRVPGSRAGVAGVSARRSVSPCARGSGARCPACRPRMRTWPGRPIDPGTDARRCSRPRPRAPARGEPCHRADHRPR